MNRQASCSNSEACLHLINSKFGYYKTILDQEQQTCDRLIASLREQASSHTDDNEQFRSSTGYDRAEFISQLDYFEQEAFKTYEENKTCLFKMFQHLFHLHREYAFAEVLSNEHRIAESFQYRPSLLSNIEKLRSAAPTPQTHSAKSFSNRADIAAFQRKKEAPTPRIPSPIESNEIDLTKLIRAAQSNTASEQFKFSQLSENWQEQKSLPTPAKKPPPRTTTPCDDALLSAANKRFVLLYNMNVIHILNVFDMQKDQTNEFQWDEGVILSLGHVESNTFYLITSTKIFLYDIVKEKIQKQYFFYDTLYKDLFVITDDLSYRTPLKRQNQMQSTVYDDYCYYLYTNKEYNQILIKCSLDSFQTELNLNLSKKHPQVEHFLGFTVTKSLITFLVVQSNVYQLLFCDESPSYDPSRTIPIDDSRDARQILSTFLPNIPVYPVSTKKNKAIKYGKQLWFVLDTTGRSIHCLTYEKYLTRISPATSRPIQSISIFEDQLLLASNELSVEIIDLDSYFSSLKL